MQLSALRDCAKRRSWTVALRVEEVGSGVSQLSQREEPLRAARQREIDAILVWRLDRWGRSLVDRVTTLQDSGEPNGRSLACNFFRSEE
jgi:DNA invertase Pin-like site-specific DNA recombinase